MSNINQIKSKLLEMEGGAFQRLCDDWLHRKGYENINAIGMMQTTNKVVQGTPDSLILHENGTYIFSEYSSQDKSLASKFEDDINKCLDETKTRIKTESISEIILCHLAKLSTDEINRLTQLCKSNSIKLTLYGIDPIALSIQSTYPRLSELYLDLPLDTGQLLEPDDFVDRYGSNNLTTPINNDLLFQDENISQCISLLEKDDLLIVSGPAGVGKTLFCVNLVKRCKKINSEIKAYCIFDKGADLHNDITSHLSEPGDYLVFIDDANRLDNRIDYLLNYLNEKGQNRTFKIIATVRDYARDNVVEKAKSFSKFQELSITPLTDEQIKELIETLFGIKNHEYQDRIIDISGGNPRLSIMASKVATESKQIASIANVASLYDDYFGNNKSVRDIISNEHLMRVACAISFYRRVDKENEDQSNTINNIFGIDHSDFWECVKTLHKNEIVDLYEEEVVKISDQVLSTYLFYISIFKEEIIPFSVLIESFYPSQKQRIVDSLNPVINSFDHKEIISKIRSQVIDIFNTFKMQNQVDTLSFLNSFWFALPTESLSYSKEIIDCIQEEEIDWEIQDFEKKNNNSCKDQIISLLTSFRFYGESELNISLDLILNYIKRTKDPLDSVIHCLTETYNFKLNDLKYGYPVQKLVIDKLYDRMDEGNNYLFTRLFILSAKEYLAVEHREHRSKGMSINILTFRLTPDEYITPIREKIFSGISYILNNKKYTQPVIDLLKNYALHIPFNGGEMALSDLPALEKHIVKNLDNRNISHCLLVDDLTDKYKSIEISYPDNWDTEFNNISLEISNLLLEDRTEKRMLEMSDVDYKNFRKEQIASYLSGKTLDEIDDFFNQCRNLHGSLTGRERDYSLCEGLQLVFTVLAETHPVDFINIISSYLKHDDIFSLNPHSIMIFLLKSHGANEIFDFIDSKKFKWKNSWITCWYSQLSEKNINDELVEKFLNHLKSIDLDCMPYWLDFLEQYRSVEEDIYVKTAQILTNRAEENIGFIRPLSNLFNIHNDNFGKWVELLNGDTTLLLKAYLLSFQQDIHFDYSGKCLNILMDYDRDLLTKVIDAIYEKEKYPSSYTSMPDLKFLWERASFYEDVESYAKHVVEKEKNSYGIRDSIFTQLFTKEKGVEDTSEIVANKEMFLKRNYSPPPT
ncbi:MAG: DNA replication protein [Gammaproteobacteria bacterium]|nr:DNA replication protein [Gammaproteobacteria bacterium]